VDISLTKVENHARIDVWPYSGDLLIDNQHTFRAKGGKPPYTWSCDNERTGKIDAQSGVFTALQLGSCKILVTDAEGRTGISGDVNVKNPKDPLDSPCFFRTILQ